MQRQQWRNNGEKLKKIPAWQLTKVRNKEEVIEEVRNQGRKLHFASLMDLCHLKNSELNLIFKSTKEGLYSEVTLYRMILVRRQCSLNKDHQHLK